MDIIIGDAEKKYLLALARETIAASLEGRKAVYGPLVKPPGEAVESALAKPRGAFVTLHSGRDLRGCIGRMSSPDPLEETVKTMALEAAFGDPRFPPLRKEELPRTTLEISVLSPMEICGDPGRVKLGVHGLYLIHQGRAGVLLPQVPLEQGWDLGEYLDYICVKAGLPPKSYEAPGALLYTFSAAVFGE